MDCWGCKESIFVSPGEGMDVGKYSLLPCGHGYHASHCMHQIQRGDILGGDLRYKCAECEEVFPRSHILSVKVNYEPEEKIMMEFSDLQSELAHLKSIIQQSNEYFYAMDLMDHSPCLNGLNFPLESCYNCASTHHLISHCDQDIFIREMLNAKETSDQFVITSRIIKGMHRTPGKMYNRFRAMMNELLPNVGLKDLLLSYDRLKLSFFGMIVGALLNGTFCWNCGGMFHRSRSSVMGAERDCKDYELAGFSNPKWKTLRHHFMRVFGDDASSPEFVPGEETGHKPFSKDGVFLTGPTSRLPPGVRTLILPQKKVTEFMMNYGAFRKSKKRFGTAGHSTGEAEDDDSALIHVDQMGMRAFDGNESNDSPVPGSSKSPSRQSASSKVKFHEIDVEVEELDVELQGLLAKTSEEDEGLASGAESKLDASKRHGESNRVDTTFFDNVELYFKMKDEANPEHTTSTRFRPKLGIWEEELMPLEANLK